MLKRSFCLVLLFLLVACGDNETPIAVLNIEPTVASEKPVVITNVPTDPSPTDVVATPTARATNTVAPTSTTSPTSTPAPTDTPIATVTIDPTAIYLNNPIQFVAQNRNPLTGETVDEALLRRRPILCKISNSPKQWVLPQSGLNAADLVFEHYAESSVTRFTAVFYGETPSRVGPVRSARKIDLELPLMYDGALCFSGGSSGPGVHRGVQDRVAETQFAERVLYPWMDAGYYRTGEDKPWEHTFYTDLTAAWRYLDILGQNQAPKYVSQMTFSEDLPASVENRYVSVQYGQGDLVEWVYDSAIEKYRRWANGNPVVDEIDGLQVTANNVVIIMAPHIIDRNICETQTATECIAFSTEIQIWGGGFAQFFRDGRQVNGEWARPDRDKSGQMFTFQIVGGEQDGEVMPLSIGNTWFQVVPYDYLPTAITTSDAPPSWYTGD